MYNQQNQGLQSLPSQQGMPRRRMNTNFNGFMPQQGMPMQQQPQQTGIAGTDDIQGKQKTPDYITQQMLDDRLGGYQQKPEESSSTHPQSLGEALFGQQYNDDGLIQSISKTILPMFMNNTLGGNMLPFSLGGQLLGIGKE